MPKTAKKPIVSRRSAKSQAAHAVRQKVALGKPRHGNRDDGVIHSKGTARSYESSLKGVTEYIQKNKLGDLKGLTPDIAVNYLEMRSQEVGQKTLNLDKEAMQAILGVKLPTIESELDHAKRSRAYTDSQVQMIAEAQRERNSAATIVARNGGLRAHELLAMAPIKLQPEDTHRTFRQDRFAGREDSAVEYTTQGKGGLIRIFVLDADIAAALEERRLDTPKIVYDRDVRYVQYYDIAGGKNWSSSFSAAASRALGWSEGAHGLRHSFAQERMNALQGLGYSYEDSLEIVSQEMGHFRSSITLVYLR